ncbi:MAG TPA: NrfD/PsrC family molybdoenzyme membrane anchor subunit [Candidatus Eisenbacteria bacterium]|nr:NrfD/PsrC family molybdoenzyme membrane anchor subunit [Candidatus Eisenbacteria bacterium]
MEAMKGLTYRKINEDIASIGHRVGKAWLVVFGLDLLVLTFGICCWFYQLFKGLGVTGYTRPAMWAVYITNFVFWVGIAHSGTLISAILFLFRAGWRQAIYRVSEAMTVFAVMTAGLFPLIHLGRIWFFYWLIPYPNQRQIWVNFRSPLVWDVFAVSTYFTVSAIFFVVGMIPDIAAMRDRETGLRKKLYSLLALGWRGTSRNWKHYAQTYIYFAAFATPLVLSVHSVVSWDFAMAQNPGWHSTIFAPYFVAGAIFSGMALVVTLIVPIRKAFKLEQYITDWHFDAMAKLILFTGNIVTYSYLVEFFMAWYSGNPYERQAFWDRAFGPMGWAFWVMAACNCIIPQLLWKRRNRTHIPTLFVITLFVNVGMWYERFVIIVQSLNANFSPWIWRGGYKPTFVEWGITAGSFAWFFMYFLLFVRFLPTFSITELKEILPRPFRRSRKEKAA